MNKLTLIAIGAALTLGGCASGPHPVAYGGNYYMLESKCKSVVHLSGTIVKCLDANGNSLGPRYAMKPYEVQAYAYRQAQDTAAMNQMIQNNNAMLNAQASQARHGVAEAPMPQPDTYGQENTYSHYACRNATGQVIQCKELD